MFETPFLRLGRTWEEREEKERKRKRNNRREKLRVFASDFSQMEP